MYLCALQACLGSVDIRRGRQLSWDWSYRWLWATTWEQGIELGSSTRATSVLNWWVISPAPFLIFCVQNYLCYGINMFSQFSFPGGISELTSFVQARSVLPGPPTCPLFVLSAHSLSIFSATPEETTLSIQALCFPFHRQYTVLVLRLSQCSH